MQRPVSKSAMPFIFPLFCAAVTLLALTSPGHAESGINTDSIYAKAKGLVESGNPVTALPLLEQVNLSRPGDQEVRNYLFRAYKFVGIEHYTQNRLQKAIEVWEKALIIDPGNTEIEDYIERCRHELRAMDKISGKGMADSNLPKIADRTEIDPSTIPPGPGPMNPPASKPDIRTDAVTRYLPPHKPAMGLASGLAFGLMMPEDDNPSAARSKWLFSGNMMLYSRASTIGGRLDVIYGRLTSEPADYDPAGFERYTSIFGAGLSLTGQIMPLPGLPISIMAGAGLYEVTRHDYIDDSIGEIFERKTIPGYSLGAGLSHRMGRLAMTFEARYLILNSDLAPNSLQFLIGLEVL